MIDRPDILIFEGINVLQSRDLPADGKCVPMVLISSTFRSISMPRSLIHSWYVNRFMRLRETAFQNPQSFFHRYATISEDCGARNRRGLWHNINLKNLHQNILPTRPPPDLILQKGPNHLTQTVALRKL